MDPVTDLLARIDLVLWEGEMRYRRGTAEVPQRYQPGTMKGMTLRNVNLRLDDDLLAKIDASAAAYHRSRSQWMRLVLADAAEGDKPVVSTVPVQVPNAPPPPVSVQAAGPMTGYPPPNLVVVDQAQHPGEPPRLEVGEHHRHRESTQDGYTQTGPVRNGVRTVRRWCDCGAELPPLTVKG